MKNNNKLFNSIVTGKFEILENIDTGSKSVPFKPRSNGNIKLSKLILKKEN